MNIEAVIEFVKAQLQNEKTGHDFYHGQRVAHLALKMYLADHPEASETSRISTIIKTAGYLHDTIDEKICADPQKVIDEIPIAELSTGVKNRKDRFEGRLTRLLLNINRNTTTIIFSRYIRSSPKSFLASL